MSLQCPSKCTGNARNQHWMNAHSLQQYLTEANKTPSRTHGGRHLIGDGLHAGDGGMALLLGDGDEIDAGDGVVRTIPRRYDALVRRIAVTQDANPRPGRESE